jgi:two-component system sensor histidine kinase PilS (NtrC family)
VTLSSGQRSEPSEDTSRGVLSLVETKRSHVPPRSIRARLSYLLLFRTLIITILLLTTIVLRLGAGQPLFAAASIVLYGVCIGSYATILVGALWLRRFDTWGIVPLAYVQLSSDTVVAAVLVVTTGGSESAFVFLFSLAILNAAAVMGRRPAIIFAIANSLLYVAIVFVQLSDQARTLELSRLTLVAAMPSMVANTLAFFLVAILSGSLTEQLKRASEGLDVAKAQLAEVGALHEAVLRSLPSGVLTTDTSGRVVFVNDAAKDILLLRPDDVLDRPVDEVLPGIPDDAKAQSRFEIVLPRQDQIHIIGGSVAHMAHVSLGGTVIVFQDLTELRRLQGAVARAERLQTVGRFAAGLAHEVRNPLAAIVGCLQLLAKAGDLNEDDAHRMIDIAHREAQRLSTLVSDFLLYARPTPPELAAIDLSDLVMDSIAGARAAMTATGELVTIDTAVDGPILVLADNAQVRQIMWNLINNAIAATTSTLGTQTTTRSPRILVTVTSRRGNGEVIIDDTGPGIPAENRARVFVPFFTTRATGTGLGLPTAHQLALGQGGEIDLEDSPLGGARFILTLPLAEPGAHDG